MAKAKWQLQTLYIFLGFLVRLNIEYSSVLFNSVEYRKKIRSPSSKHVL